MPELGRVPGPADQRDANFPMTLAASMLGAAPPSRYWYPGGVALNQGNVGACVGFTGANWMQNSPIRTSVQDQTGLDLYAACKKVDGLPNVEGTYARVLLKILQDQGRVARYLWAMDGEQLNQWVRTTGPVLVGTPWRSGMFTVKADGFLDMTGSVVGGHEYLVRGYSRPLDAYRCRNSWGASWGIGQGSKWSGGGGEFWIKRLALEALIWGVWGDAVGIEETRVE